MRLRKFLARARRRYSRRAPWMIAAPLLIGFVVVVVGLALGWPRETIEKISIICIVMALVLALLFLP